ncbi:MAG: hypothetical protein ABSH20_18995 [Tepidisphaeraceae bacterium]
MTPELDDGNSDLISGIFGKVGTIIVKVRLDGTNVPGDDGMAMSGDAEGIVEGPQMTGLALVPGGSGSRWSLKLLAGVPFQ